MTKEKQIARIAPLDTMDYRDARKITNTVVDWYNNQRFLHRSQKSLVETLSWGTGLSESAVRYIVTEAKKGDEFVFGKKRGVLRDRFYEGHIKGMVDMYNEGMDLKDITRLHNLKSTSSIYGYLHKAEDEGIAHVAWRNPEQVAKIKEAKRAFEAREYSIEPVNDVVTERKARGSGRSRRENNGSRVWGALKYITATAASVAAFIGADIASDHLPDAGQKALEIFQNSNAYALKEADGIYSPESPVSVNGNLERLSVAANLYGGEESVTIYNTGNSISEDGEFLLPELRSSVLDDYLNRKPVLDLGLADLPGRGIEAMVAEATENQVLTGQSVDTPEESITLGEPSFSEVVEETVVAQTVQASEATVANYVNGPSTPLVEPDFNVATAEPLVQQARPTGEPDKCALVPGGTEATSIRMWLDANKLPSDRFVRECLTGYLVEKGFLPDGTEFDYPCTYDVNSAVLGIAKSNPEAIYDFFNQTQDPRHCPEEGELEEVVGKEEKGGICGCVTLDDSIDNVKEAKTFGGKLKAAGIGVLNLSTGLPKAYEASKAHQESKGAQLSEVVGSEEYQGQPASLPDSFYEVHFKKNERGDVTNVMITSVFAPSINQDLRGSEYRPGNAALVSVGVPSSAIDIAREEFSNPKTPRPRKKADVYRFEHFLSADKLVNYVNQLSGDLNSSIQFNVVDGQLRNIQVGADHLIGDDAQTKEESEAKWAQACAALKTGALVFGGVSVLGGGSSSGSVECVDPVIGPS